MRDPSEVLYTLLDIISTAVQPGGQGGGPDAVTGVVTLPAQLHRECSACGARSDELNFMQLIHNVPACVLRDAAAAVGGCQEAALHLGELLRAAGQKYSHPCCSLGEYCTQPHPNPTTTCLETNQGEC